MELVTGWYWFNEVDYTGIFVRSLTAKASLGGFVFLIAFWILALNFRLALRRVTKPYVLFPGSGDIPPVVLEQRQLQLLGTAVASLVALFLGIFASNEWLTWLQYQNAVPFGQFDPLFGRDVAYYVFMLPFYDVARYLAMAIVVLSLLGSTAAYVASGTLALDPARGLVIGAEARRHLGTGFSLPGKLRGDDVDKPNSGEPPWAWEDRDADNIPRGAWFIDPAWALAQRVDMPGEVWSDVYCWNPYLGIEDHTSGGCR